MRWNLMTREKIAQEVAKRHRKASVKEKGHMLDEFSASGRSTTAMRQVY